MQKMCKHHPLDVRLCARPPNSLDGLSGIHYNVQFWNKKHKHSNDRSTLKMGHFAGFLFIVPCGKFESPDPGKAQQLTEQRYPFLSVHAVFLCVQTMVWLPVLGIFNMHTDVDACRCMCTWELYEHHKLWKSALKGDSGRKIPCHNRDSNRHQYCAYRLFSWMLNQLSYPRPLRLFYPCLNNRNFVVVAAFNLGSGHRHADLLSTNEEQKKVGSRCNNYTLLPQASALLAISKTDCQIQNGSIYSCFYATSNFSKFDYKSTERLLWSKQASGFLVSCQLRRVNSGRSNSGIGK